MNAVKPIDAIRYLKHAGAPMTALQKAAWEAWFERADETLANELFAKDARIAELESGFEILANATVEDGWIKVAPQFVHNHLKGKS